MRVTGSKANFQNYPLIIYGIPFLVLLIGLTLSYQLWNLRQQAYQQRIVSELHYDANRITRSIEQRLNAYQLVLRGARGLINGSEVVNRDEFSKYIKTLELEQFYPGIHGVGLALMTPHSDKKNHINRIKAEGFTDYAIRPQSTSEFYAPIVYMEPFIGPNIKVLGLDVYKVPAASDYLITARDTGELTISQKLILAQYSNQNRDDEKPSIDASFVMYLPVYKNNLPIETLAQRQANIYGWIDAPFRMHDFMSAVLDQVPANVDVEIFDGDIPTEENMLFDLDGIPFHKGVISDTHKININGHIWTLTYNHMSSREQYQLLVAISGIILSLLSMLLALSLTTGRSRAIFLANQLSERYKKSERLFRAYFEHSNVGMATNTPQKEWVNVNDALCQMFGYTREELFKKSWSRLTYSEDLAEELVLYERLRNGEITNYSFNKRVIHKSGYLLNVQVFIQAIYKDSGDIDFFAALIQDVTEKTKAEENLRATEIRFRDMVNSIDGVVREADVHDFTITYISKQVEQLTGFTTDEWKQPKFWVENIHPEDRKWVVEHTQQCTEQLKNHDNEYRFIKKDGSIIWFRDMVTIVAENGLPNCLRGIMIDITKEKEAENYQKHLELQLRQSQKMEALGTLSGGIAHDFNNMLGIILGNTELLDSNISSGNDFDKIKASKHLNSLKAAGQRAVGLVAQILTFSRMSPEKLTVINISDVVIDAIAMLRETISSKINIKLEIDDDIGQIMANENQIHQIIVNLFTNAVHALEGKSDEIKVSIKHKTLKQTKGKSVCLCVSDKGKGIAKENLQRIFDPFFTTKEVGEGTGLGLAVIHGIVKNHGGEITVESEEGKGTTFFIHFPVYGDNSVEDTKTSETDTLDELQILESGKGCILLVEDELQLQSMYQEFLEELGYKIICKNDGIEALNYYENNIDSIDLVLTDLAMPELTGVELTEKLLKLRADLPIILMTGFSDGMTESDIKKLGIQQCLLKPVAFNLLSQAIKESI